MKGDNMPGFILHLLHGKFLLESGEFSFNETEKMQFRAGLMIPDAYKKDYLRNEKSHFFPERTRPEFVRVPDLDMFSEKYAEYFHDPYVAGYAAHLYADRFFFPDYLSEYISYADKNGVSAVSRDDITDVVIKKSGLKVSRDRFFSSEYFYGDYSRLNHFLINKYDLKNIRYTETSDIIDEADSKDLRKVISDLERYLTETPEDTELKVLTCDSVENEFRKYTEGFVHWYKDICSK